MAKKQLVREFVGKPAVPRSKRLTEKNMTHFIQEFNKAGNILAPVVNELRQTGGADEFKKMVTAMYDDMVDLQIYIEERLKSLKASK